MIQDVDLNDLKNQYLDNLESKEPTNKSTIIESLHILYHISVLKQDPLGALKYALQLDLLLASILNASEKKLYLLEAICVSSIIGFQYIKYAQQDLQEVPKEPPQFLGDFLGSYALE
jgi:hypothetical protein